MRNPSLTAFVAIVLFLLSIKLEVMYSQRVFGFGANVFGELAVGNQFAVYSPIQLDSSLRIASNSPSAAHSMFISDQSKVLVSGNNEFAQFGNGLNFLLNNTELVPSEGTAQSTFRSRSIIETAGGRYFSLFLDSRRTVLSCGISSTFLGRIPTALRPSSEPFSISFLNSNITYLDNIQDTILSIHAGSDFSILLTRKGKVISFGNNNYGQLGVGDLHPRQLPTEVPLSEPILQVAVGSLHVLALAESGNVYVWGANHYEQLGRTGAEALLPELLITSTWNISQPILRVAAGTFHSMIIFQDSSVMVLFGSNEFGQIMGETPFSTFSIIDVKQFINIESESVSIKQITGSHANTYFITSQGGMYSMGDALGLGEAYFPVTMFENDTTNSTDPSQPKPQQIFQIVISELDNSIPKTLATTSFAAFVIEGTVCHGVYHNSSSVCSGHGKCIEYDTCQCEEKYFGRDCEMTYCKGIASNDSQVCEGKGACLQEDFCTCFNKTLWGGSNCETPICYGIAATMNTVCSGYGSCMAPNQCQCKENYFGDACQFTTCFGEDSFNTSICGNGTCIAYNTCHCKEDFSGDRCQYYKPTPKPTIPMPKYSSNSMYKPSEATNFVLPLPPTIAASVVMFLLLCFGFFAFVVILVLFALLVYRRYLTQREKRLGKLLEEAKQLHIDIEMPNVIKTGPILGEEDVM